MFHCIPSSAFCIKLWNVNLAVLHIKSFASSLLKADPLSVNIVVGLNITNIFVRSIQSAVLRYSGSLWLTVKPPLLLLQALSYISRDAWGSTGADALYSFWILFVLCSSLMWSFVCRESCFLCSCTSSDSTLTRPKSKNLENSLVKIVTKDGINGSACPEAVRLTSDCGFILFFLHVNVYKIQYRTRF